MQSSSTDPEPARPNPTVPPQPGELSLRQSGAHHLQREGRRYGEDAFTRDSCKIIDMTSEGNRWGSGADSACSPGDPARIAVAAVRPILEVLLWLLGQCSEQGVMLHVCSKAFQRRPFRMTSLEVGARRAWRAVGGAWRDSATMCYSGPGAGRSGGVLPGPVALRALEVASYRRSRRPGVREHHAPVGALRRPQEAILQVS